jgi:hypothetical protein
VRAITEFGRQRRGRVGVDIENGNACGALVDAPSRHGFAEPGGTTGDRNN